MGGGVDGRMSCWNAMKNNSSRTKACQVKCVCGVCVAFIINADIICEASSDQPLPPPLIIRLPPAPLPPQELLPFVI